MKRRLGFTALISGPVTKMTFPETMRLVDRLRANLALSDRLREPREP